MKITGKIKTLTIASLSAVALAAPVTFAQTTTTTQDTKQVTRGEGHGGHRKDGERGAGWGRGVGEGRGMHGMMFRGANLTDEQKAKMKTISQSFRERTQSLRQALRAKRQELRQANEGNTFNEALATQKLTETAGLQAKLMGEEFRMRQDMLSVLTTEQKAQLEQKRAEFKAKRAGRGEWKSQ